MFVIRPAAVQAVRDFAFYERQRPDDEPYEQRAGRERMILKKELQCYRQSCDTYYRTDSVREQIRKVFPEITEDVSDGIDQTFVKTQSDSDSTAGDAGGY